LLKVLLTNIHLFQSYPFSYKTNFLKITLFCSVLSEMVILRGSYGLSRTSPAFMLVLRHLSVFFQFHAAIFQWLAPSPWARVCLQGNDISMLPMPLNSLQCRSYTTGTDWTALGQHLHNKEHEAGRQNTWSSYSVLQLLFTSWNPHSIQVQIN